MFKSHCFIYYHFSKLSLYFKVTKQCSEYIQQFTPFFHCSVESLGNVVLFVSLGTSNYPLRASSSLLVKCDAFSRCPEPGCPPPQTTTLKLHANTNSSLDLRHQMCCLFKAFRAHSLGSSPAIKKKKKLSTSHQTA